MQHTLTKQNSNYCSASHKQQARPNLDPYKQQALSSAQNKIAVDSGASGHYFRVSDSTTLLDKHKSTSTATVRFPNGQSIHSVQEGYIDLPFLSKEGCRVQTFQDNDLREFSLLAVGQL